MAGLQFDGEMARLQQAIAQCHDLVARRTAVLDAVHLSPGEHVLEFGCGGGFYSREAARFVGASGAVCAIDISEDQIAMAKQNCDEFSHVECQVANVLEIPYEDGRFDAVYGVQVLEYVPELEKALSEIHRVLKRGGRFVLLATNWDSLVWHSENPERMQKVLQAFDKHAPFPNLPSILPTKLRKGGFQVVRQLPITVLNTSSSENAFSQYLAPMVKGFVQSQGLVPEDELEAWAAELGDLNEKGEYWFASTTVITEGLKPV